MNEYIDPMMLGRDESRGVTPPTERVEEAAEIGIIKQLSPKKVKEEVRMNLLGYDWDYHEEKWIKTREPLMNDKGVNKYMSILSSVITDLVTFSNYRPEDVPALTRHICEKAIPVIYINWREFGVESKSDLPTISLQLFNLSYAAFKKALGAGDRNVIRGTVQESMNQRASFYPQMPQPQQKKGILGRLNPFNRR